MPKIHWKSLFDDEFDNFIDHKHAHDPLDLSVDLYNQNGALIVEMILAGINPDHVDISVEDTVLKISGNREEKTEVEDKNYYRKEIRRGKFERIVPLPTAVATDQARAEFKDGLLRIYLPKQTSTPVNKIKITKAM